MYRQLAPLLLAGLASASARAQSTPIRHLVVIFQENVSFDHYFASYPGAANPAGEPRFVARAGTPAVNGLTGALLTLNPNQVNPFRLGRAQAATCDQDHDYGDEQKAMHGGLMDLFVQTVGNGPGTDGNLSCHATDVMGYFDGNTVTAIWNYAQRFAISDNSFATTFGPSSPGAINLVSGQTHGATPADLPGNTVRGTLIGDLRPLNDDCSPGGGFQPNQVVMSGRNVGDLLNARGVTWGWFQGGFAPTARTAAGKAICGATHTGSDGLPKGDYLPHHQPFQYYPSTANPHHLPPSAVSAIGSTDPANHQYDLTDFWAAVDAGRLPAVSFLKARAFEDGHAGYSDPLAEQRFIVDAVNRLQARPEWRQTAVIVAYDDSDGWYDHVMPPIVSQSSAAEDQLLGPGNCGTAPSGAAQGRCGYGPRLPLLAISPWAKENFVDHSITDQSSILRFIEENWQLGRIGDDSFDARAGSLDNLFDFSRPRRGRLLLDPQTGLAVDDD
jgi:phospholipase C